MKMRVILVLLFTASTSFVFAQELEEYLISGDFQNIPFRDFVESIESQTPLKIFYNPSIGDTIPVSIKVDNIPLNTLFNDLFEGTKIRAYFYSEAVFIVHDLILFTELPSDFLASDTSETSNEEILMDISDVSENEKLNIGTKTSRITRGNAFITGRIINKHSGEPVFGASVFIQKPLTGSVSDINGFFSLEVPKGHHSLTISSVGMQEKIYDVAVYSDGELNVELELQATSLSEVVVEAERDENLNDSKLGVEKLNIKDVKLVPTALGESDIVRAMLTLPGVKTVGEASNGINVRGGSTEQNLILFNNSTIYNQSHLFGFFSSFNPDVIKSVDLYKGSIPAQYGGRLSSVLHINSKRPDTAKISGSGGIGLVTGRLMIEAPITKKTSFLIAGRANYSNWILRTIENEDYQNSSGSFYDLNFDVNHVIDDENTLTVYGYRSNDSFKLRNDTLYRYSNNAASINWRRSKNNLYSDISLGFSNYSYKINQESNPINAFELGFGISQGDVKGDFNYFLPSGHSINGGFGFTYYNLSSGSLKPLGSESEITSDVLQNEKAIESTFYISDSYDLSDKLNINLGARFITFRNIGPRDYFQYAENVPKTDETIVDTVSVSAGRKVKAFNVPEIRISARYSLTDRSSIKVGFNTNNQFIHRMSNTVAISPTDTWKLSDANIEPQRGSQFSAGYFQNSQSGVIQFSLEAYFKGFKNFLDYKSGAILIMNPNLEADVINTRGRAYGMELLVKKNRGKLTGWVGYTYSRSELRQDDALAGELINDGAWYPANFDKPHDLSLVSNYKLSRRYSISINATYSTGRPITIPLEQFLYGGTNRVLYSDRNGFRVPDYFRADMAFLIEGNHKKSKLAHGSWSIAVYNITGRRNANSVYFVSEPDGIQGYRLAIFGRPIPTITYNFKF